MDNKVAFTIFGFGVKYYSIMILIGIIIGFTIAELYGRKKGYPKDTIFDLGFYCVIFGILGARLYFVLFNLSTIHSFFEIFAVWEGGMAIHGGILAGLITTIVFCKKRNINILEMTDLIVVSLIIAQAIGRWGNFFNGELYGAKVDPDVLRSYKIIPEFVIKGMNIKHLGIYYQPLFYYESLWNLLGFIILLSVRKIFKDLKSGQLTCIYMMWYGVGRFLLEPLRNPSFILTVGNSIRVSQVVSGLLLGVGLILFIALFFIDLFKKDETK